MDGAGNNLANPAWGTPGTALVRAAPAAFGDGIGSPGGADRLSARDLSNLVFDQHRAEDIFNGEGMSAFVYAWGQFVDHDMSLTNDAKSPAEPLDIAVPAGDPYFDPTFSGTQTIGFNRSQVVSGTGTSTSNPRQNPNSVTAFLDGSQVYGSDAVRAAALRTFVGGKLKTSDNGTELPYNTPGLDNQTAGGPASAYFLAGDVRANENSELTSLHVLFLREHNRLADMVHKLRPHWTDEQLYQEARRLVIGEIERITYNEFLPSILHKYKVSKYTGYKPKVNPQVSNEFSTAAMRFGHSIVGDDVQFFDDDAQATLPDLKVAQTFFSPSQQLGGGTDGLLKYLAAVSSQEMDPIIVNGIRNFLFGPPGAGGFDLGALDIQRGRDHGLADLNTTRAAIGLKKYTSFSQLTANTSLATFLQTVFGSIDNVDLFVGGMVENHTAGGVMGETFEKLLADQFTRTRDGDRFWYQNSLDSTELSYVNGMTLSKLIKLNSSITNIQSNAFHFDVKVSGRAWNDSNGNGKFDKNETPLANATVTLSAVGGADGGSDLVIDFFKTDAKGNYLFDKLQVGDYRVDVVDSSAAPAGLRSTTADSRQYTFHVNTDQQFVHNFGLQATTGSTASLNTVFNENTPADVTGAISGLAVRGGVTPWADTLTITDGLLSEKVFKWVRLDHLITSPPTLCRISDL